MNATKSAPRFVSDNQVLVTKAFAKSARVFGTDEYKTWREILKDVPSAKMVTKKIARNPNKRTATKNMTYENMAAYIKAQENAEALMMEFKKQLDLSQIQTNPYRSVLAWFKQKFEGYDNYKKYFEDIAAEEAKKNEVTYMAVEAANSTDYNDER